MNVASTNLNYGGSNGTLTDYKKSANGIQAGVSFQAGITPGFSLVSELYFMRKGGKLKTNNPLTTNESSLRLNIIELPVLARFILVNSILMRGHPSLITLVETGKLKRYLLNSHLQIQLKGLNVSMPVFTWAEALSLHLNKEGLRWT